MSTKYVGGIGTAELASAGNRAEVKDPSAAIRESRDDKTQQPKPEHGKAEPERPEHEHAGPLLPEAVTRELGPQWDIIQTGFVDEPRAAVQQADELVAQAMKKLAESFAGERKKLEQQWDRGGDVSTEDLRLALQKYRAFFHRLLSI